MSLPAVGTEKTRAIRPRMKFEGHTGSIHDVMHLPGGQRIMTCSEDGSLRVWNLKTGEQIGSDWRDGESAVNAIALSPDEKQVVSGNVDGAVKLWDIDTGKVITSWTGHTSTVKSVCWNRDGGRVLSGSYDRTARVWDVERGETILAIKGGLCVYSAIYSPDETMIATGGYNEEEYIKIFDAKTGKLVANLQGHTAEVPFLAWTADGTTLISGSWDCRIITWNTTTWQQINVFNGPRVQLCDLAISPNGRILASAARDFRARLWNLENGHLIASPLQHARWTQCVSFSTDGQLLATGCDSGDNNAYTWDIATIVTEAGLEELLLNSNDGQRSLLEADATRRTGQRRRRDNINPDRPLPPGFFDDSPRHPPSSSRRPLSPSSTYQHPAAGYLSSDELGLLGRLSSLFRSNNYNIQDAPPRTRLLERARNLFSRIPHRHDEGTELQERRPAVVDVPFTRGTPRNISAAEVRWKKEQQQEKARMAKEKEKEKAKNASAGSSRPPPGSVTQQFGGATEAQPSSSELHAAAPTPPTTSGVASVATTRWTRFWLTACCMSAQYTDGHH